MKSLIFPVGLGIARNAFEILPADLHTPLKANALNIPLHDEIIRGGPLTQPLSIHSYIWRLVHASQDTMSVNKALIHEQSPDEICEDYPRKLSQTIEQTSASERASSIRSVSSQRTNSDFESDSDHSTIKRKFALKKSRKFALGRKQLSTSDSTIRGATQVLDADLKNTVAQNSSTIRTLIRKKLHRQRRSDPQLRLPGSDADSERSPSAYASDSSQSGPAARVASDQKRQQAPFSMEMALSSMNTNASRTKPMKKLPTPRTSEDDKTASSDSSYVLIA